jgi:hypothetical protein
MSPTEYDAIVYAIYGLVGSEPEHTRVREVRQLKGFFFVVDEGSSLPMG